MFVSRGAADSDSRRDISAGRVKYLAMQWRAFRRQ